MLENQLKMRRLRRSMAKGYTDEQGKVTFIVEEGIYSWKVSKEEHETKWGRVTITEDVTVEVELPILSPPISTAAMITLWTSILAGGVASII